MTQTIQQKINKRLMTVYVNIVNDSEYWVENLWEILGLLPVEELDSSYSIDEKFSILRYWGLRNLAKKMYSVADNINEFAELLKQNHEKKNSVRK